MRADERKNIIEMALLCSQDPLSVSAIRNIFASARDDATEVTSAQVHESMEQLAADWEGRGLVLTESAGGWQFKTREQYKNFAVATLREKPPKLSRALLEVLSVIAYHQPATRGDIEKVRGVSVFPNHIRHLEDLGWIKPAGAREVPGRPMTYVTTTAFLDDLGLSSLDDLPELGKELDIEVPPADGDAEGEQAAPEESSGEESPEQPPAEEKPEEQAEKGESEDKG